MQHASYSTYKNEVQEVSLTDTLRLREWVGNEFPHFHSPVDTKMQMPCHPKFSLDKHRSAQRGARSCGCSPWWKIHTPLLPRHHSESTEFRNMNQLQCKTQLSGHNTCILIDVNLDTFKPIKSHATHSFPIARVHTQNRTDKQILSKTLLLQEIVKALASLSEYVVFVNT